MAHHVLNVTLEPGNYTTTGDASRRVRNLPGRRAKDVSLLSYDEWLVRAREAA